MKILIKNIKLENANIFQNALCEGIPSPLSVLGFADNLHRKIAKKLSLENQNFYTASAIYVVHESVQKTSRFLPDNNENGITLEVVEPKLGDCKISLLVDIDVENVMLETIISVIERMSLAGTKIMDDLKYKIEINTPASKEFLKKIPAGYLIAPGIYHKREGSVEFFKTLGEKEEYQKYTPIEEFIKLLQRPENEIFDYYEKSKNIKSEKNKEASEENNAIYDKNEEISAQEISAIKRIHERFIPVAIGYHFLRKPSKTKIAGIRNKDDLYAEAAPIAGLAEIISTRDTILTTENIEKNHYSWKWHGDNFKSIAHKSY